MWGEAAAEEGRVDPAAAGHVQPLEPAVTLSVITGILSSLYQPSLIYQPSITDTAAGHVQPLEPAVTLVRQLSLISASCH